MCTSLRASLQDADLAHTDNMETWCHLQNEMRKERHKYIGSIRVQDRAQKGKTPAMLCDSVIAVATKLEKRYRSLKGLPVANSPEDSGFPALTANLTSSSQDNKWEPERKHQPFIWL
ncbi:hypothetical protein AV530_009803 [Patagioenas fasciata monilis]|uniref:Uncharacterized protein n=1 Tax=Patagioenas fasciata monilis TaxID=372326 RepID=A0A1V4KAB3_PATFA|nr:hypothetical protein AV530_009803 [Patagioenas fasciata monilis]